MTWLRLWGKIGKQPIRITRNKDVTVCHKGTMYKAKLKFVKNGNDFFLETEEQTDWSDEE